MIVGDVAFSSRRRHTRWPRDWSSDVCSSDLRMRDSSARVSTVGTVTEVAQVVRIGDGYAGIVWTANAAQFDGLRQIPVPEMADLVEPLQLARSEERRVGKGCR